MILPVDFQTHQQLNLQPIEKSGFKIIILGNRSNPEAKNCLCLEQFLLSVLSVLVVKRLVGTVPVMYEAPLRASVVNITIESA